VERQEEKEAGERLAREMAKMLSELQPGYMARFDALKQASAEIQSLAEENRGFEASLLKDEMAKLEKLLQAFLRMAASHQRLSRYLQHNQGAQVEADIASCQRALASEKDPRVQVSLKQALSLAQKRLRQHQQIEGAYKALSVQMVTIEKAFDYLKSNILGMGTREELAQELDGLVSGVTSAAELEACGLDDIEEAPRAAKVVSLASKR
jgi:hypothetical protein